MRVCVRERQIKIVGAAIKRDNLETAVLRIGLNVKKKRYYAVSVVQGH